MSRRSLLLILCALVSAVGLSACGSGGNESVNGLLKDTFAGGKKVKSGRLNVALDANLQGVKSLSGPLQLKLSGPFQSKSKDELPKFDFTLAITSNGQTFTAGGVSLGTKGYVRFQDQAYSVSDQLFQTFKKNYVNAQNQSKSKGSQAPSLSALGIDPRAWLTGARKVGTANISGTDTIHIASGVAVGKLLSDVNTVLGRAGKLTGSATKAVPQSITPAQRAQIEKAVKSARVDVYTGKSDHALRKLDVAVDLRRSGTLQGGTVHFTLEIDDLNQKQTISPPQGAKPLTDLLAQLNAASGTSSGSGSTGAAPTTTTPVPSASAGGTNSAYLQCLQAAGQDLRKVQKCAALLK